jgi:hypothetical protein
MPRPIDPQSISSRLRQSFADGRPFVAYEAPADLDPSLLDGNLDSRVLRLRFSIANARRDARNSCRPADYDRLYPGDAGFGCAAWAEPELGCVYIGLRRAAGGLPRLRSIDARSSLAVGASGIARLTRRPERDINSWLRAESSASWRRAAGKAPTQVFTAALAAGEDPNGASRQADYLVTRLDDIPAGAVPPWRAAPEPVLDDDDAPPPTRKRKTVRQQDSERRAENRRIKAEMKAAALQAKLAAAEAEAADKALVRDIRLIDHELRFYFGGQGKEPNFDAYSPELVQAFRPYLLGDRKALKAAALVAVRAYITAKQQQAGPSACWQAMTDALAVPVVPDDDDDEEAAE